MVRKHKRKSGAFGSNYLKNLENSLTKIKKVNKILEGSHSPKQEIEDFNDTFASRRYQKNMNDLISPVQNSADRKVYKTKSSHRSSIKH